VPSSLSLSGGYGTGYLGTFTRGEKSYELVNHLGNVLSTITDKKIAVPSGSSSSLIDHFDPDVATAQDYYPFGMLMPGRTYPSTGSNYRWGFNGKENDNEVKGTGNQIDYGMRYYDPRAGRFMSVDPLTKKYPALTPYQYASNTPIQAVDLDGKEGGYYMGQENDRLHRLPQQIYDDNIRAQGSIKAWDGKPNYWGQTAQIVEKFKWLPGSQYMGWKIFYGILDDAHVTYTGWKYGPGYATHLDNSSVRSYDERINAGLNTTMLIFGAMTPAPEIGAVNDFSIGGQGNLGEQYFGNNLDQLVEGRKFKTFDNFTDGVATSAKTLDFEAPTYVNNPSNVRYQF
jgi:RHS repeat-associated protein